MAPPIIQSVGTVSGAGVAGQGRSDLVGGETVTLSDAEVLNIGALYFWEFIDAPIGSSPGFSSSSSPTPTFVPDATYVGSYRIRVTVNGIEHAVVVIAVPLPNTDARIPSFQETLEYNGGANDKGWHEAMTKFMRAADTRLPVTGEVQVLYIDVGDRASHNSDTPLVVGGMALNTATYSLSGVAAAFRLEIVAANGNTPLTSHVALYNLTDSATVASSVLNIVDSTEPTKYLSGVLTLPAGDKVYECRIYLNAPPGDPAIDTVELFSARVKVSLTNA